MNNTTETPPNTRSRATWEVAETFEENGIIVQVQRLRVGRVAHIYSMRVGEHLRQEDRYSPYVSMRRGDVATDGSALKLPYGEILARLGSAASRYVAERMKEEQAAEDPRPTHPATEGAGPRSPTSGDRPGRKFVRSPGKTARDRAKRQGRRENDSRT